MTLNQVDTGAGLRWVRSYTKHYYAGSQRISGALGSSPSVGTFNCDWLIIPFGNGGAPINEKDVALQKAQAAADHGNKILGQLNINGADYGQNGGYNENCTTDFSGEEELNVYWYHPDHLGSSSFVTSLDGEVNQNVEYFPSGETFVENHLNSYNTPYKFNSKELDDETGYYYYGARYYNPRVSLWLNVDPLASYDPTMNGEHYIDGEHNGGVYNSGNLNPYIYCYQSPVMYVDPNGKQTYFNSKLDGNEKPYLEYMSENPNPRSAYERSLTVINVYNFSDDKIIDVIIGQDAVAKANKLYGTHYLKEKEHISGWEATKEVAKIAWNNPESQAVLLAPVFALAEILAAGTVAEPVIFGRIKNFEKIGAYGIEEAVRNKHGIKIIAEGGRDTAVHVYEQLLKEGYKSTLKGSGDAAYYQLEKGAEKVFFRQSKSGNYSGFDTFVKPLGNGKNSTILFK